MSRYFFLLLFISCLFSIENIDAQSDDYAPGKITWGPEHKIPGNTRMAKIIGTNPKGFYSLRISRPALMSGYPDYLIEQFNHKNKVVKSKELEMKYKKKRRDFEDIMLLGDKLFLFTSFYNAGQKKKYLFAETISSVSLKQRNDLKMIGEIEDIKQRRGVFDFEVSEDSTKIMVYHSLPYKRNQEEKFAFKVFSNDFEELWQKEVTLPYNDDRYDVASYKVDNDGNIYILGKIIDDTRRIGRRKQPYYKYSILAYRDKGESFKEYQVDLKDKFITDLTISISNVGELICAGFFSEQSEYNVKGTCFIKIDAKSEQVITSNVKEFDFDFVTEYYSFSEKNRAERAEENNNTRQEAELFQMSLDKLILRSDGGAVLVAEQFYVEEFRQTNYYNTLDNRVTYYYNYNDIIVVNITPSGEIEWASRIPKRQTTLNDNGYFSSYVMSVVRDRMYFVYNDDSRNFKERRNNRNRPFTYEGNRGIIALTEINKEGSITTYPLANNRDEKITTRPKVCEQTGLYEMVIYGEDRGKFKFGELKFRPK